MEEFGKETGMGEKEPGGELEDGSAGEREVVMCRGLGCRGLGCL